MRRKNRKWVALAGALYVFVMWSAWRWSINQRPADGPILEHIQREEVRKSREREAREAAAHAEPQPPPTSQSRLTAAGPAYVAAKYDDTHVVFIVADDTESRFANSSAISSAKPRRVSAPTHPAAPLAGLQELWEPDTAALHFFPEIVQQTKPGDQWTLSVSPGWTIPVMIERVVIAPTGCSLALGFLAKVPSGYEGIFNASTKEYFVVRRGGVELAQPPLSGRVYEIRDWKPSATTKDQIEAQLNARMKDEVVRIDHRLLTNAASPGATSLPLPIGDARPRLKEWLLADRALAADKGLIEYDVRAFSLTPDGAPRLFVRARWSLDAATVFMMTAWFQQDPAHPVAAPTLLWTDSSWSEAIRNGEASVSLGDQLDFQSIVNEFDADYDAWGELLIHSYDAHPQSAQPQSYNSTSIGLFLYTDQGLVPLKTPFHRDQRSPESCLAQ